jgi:hypothetical protein
MQCHTGFLLGLLFELKNGGNILLQNIGFVQNHSVLQPRRPYSFLRLFFGYDCFINQMALQCHVFRTESYFNLLHCFNDFWVVNPSIITWPRDWPCTRRYRRCFLTVMQNKALSNVRCLTPNSSSPSTVVIEEQGQSFQNNYTSREITGLWNSHQQIAGPPLIYNIQDTFFPKRI